MLLDTSGLLCVHHKDEPQHPDALTFFQAASIRLTHSYVLTEFVPVPSAWATACARARFHCRSDW